MFHTYVFVWRQKNDTLYIFLSTPECEIKIWKKKKVFFKSIEEGEKERRHCRFNICQNKTFIFILTQMINKSLAVIKNIWKKRVYASHSNDLFNCLCLSHIFSLIWKNLTCVLVFNVVIFICNNKMTTGTVFQEWSAFHKSLSPSILFLIFVFDIIKNIERNFIFLLIFAPLFFIWDIHSRALKAHTKRCYCEDENIYFFHACEICKEYCV
jgi:hypothetical protein